MKTDYNEKNGAFSLYVHEFAKVQIYPLLFPGCEIEVDHLDGSKEDMEDKVDVKVRVKKKGFKDWFEFTIQERWRRPRYSRYRDITLTEFNNASGRSVEFYTGVMQFFLYGYFDQSKERFGEVVYIDVAKLRHKICTDEVSYTLNINEKDQNFAAIKFNDLSMTGCIEWTNSHLMPVGDMPTEMYRYLYLAKCNTITG